MSELLQAIADKIKAEFVESDIRGVSAIIVAQSPNITKWKVSIMLTNGGTQWYEVKQEKD